ncbi:MAG: bifunctional oligoribonuclease/PAP phosphatase NrnA [Gemmatimonadota bacterium]
MTTRALAVGMPGGAVDPGAWRTARELLAGAERIVLTTHVQPDGDGIGAEVALAHWLRADGKQVTILNPHPTPRRFHFLEPDPPIVAFEPAAAEAALAAADLLVVLDISIAERLGRLKPLVKELAPPILVIDHHAGPSDLPGAAVRDVKASATGEMIYRMLTAWGADLTLPIVTALYTAIAFDTGGFRYSNTRPHTLEIAADLIRRGADAERISRRLFEGLSPSRVRLLSRAYADVAFGAGGRVAWVALPLALMAETGAEPDDVEGVVEALRAIEGVAVAIVFKEVNSKATKVSFRSIGPVDVNTFAVQCGGGGHRNASGAFIPEPMEPVVARIVAAADEAFAGIAVE